jgi:hypothetical protein
VLFLDGPAEYHDRVQAHVKTWEDYADIKFAFTNDSSSEIRVTFTHATGRFYSTVGNDALLGGFSPGNHTMNLGILPDWPLGTDAVEREIRRLILHEFGHSLGLIHEHSSPEAGSFFKDPELVYAYYQQTQGWDRAMVDQNVLMTYSKGQISNSTKFDPDSIMLYQFPPQITNRPTQINYDLSSLDKLVIGQLYPKLGTKPPSDPVPSVHPASGVTPAVGRRLKFDVAVSVVHGVPGTQDVYSFEVTETGTYLMETTGDNAWGMALFESGASNTFIQKDEGGGEGLNARISRGLDPGTYCLAVEHFLPDGTGAYEIVVRKLGS